ncbi:cell wall synthesis protein CwsA [Mycobacterium sp. 155]|uniref:cell wall synthesis protein CwsA n=1 Tax=Mycobacterium sp. 155 TaxID=1157943 RepID=UPI00036747CA|nr:cell wall synthesis protein CwsA [Mycobacterium sp. 155]
MTATTDDRLAPNQRLARGLKYSAMGSVDVSRGVVGLCLQAAVAAGTSARRRYQDGQLRHQLAAVAERLEEALPDVLADAVPAKSKSKCRRRPWLIAGVAAAVLAGGAVAFSVVRRTKRPEPPATLPPSVEVSPKP